MYYIEVIIHVFSLPLDPCAGLRAPKCCSYRPEMALYEFLVDSYVFAKLDLRPCVWAQKWTPMSQDVILSVLTRLNRLI